MAQWAQRAKWETVRHLSVTVLFNKASLHDLRNATIVMDNYILNILNLIYLYFQEKALLVTKSFFGLTWSYAYCLVLNICYEYGPQHVYQNIMDGLVLFEC